MGDNYCGYPNVQDEVLEAFPDLSPRDALRMAEEFVHVAGEYDTDVGTLISEAKEAGS